MTKMKEKNIVGKKVEIFEKKNEGEKEKVEKIVKMKFKLVGSTLVTADADTNLYMGKDGSKAKLHTNIYLNTTPPPRTLRPNKGKKFENRVSQILSN